MVLVTVIALPILISVITRQNDTAGPGYYGLQPDNALPSLTDPDNAVHNFLVAKTFYESREFDEALEYLLKALDGQITVSGSMSIATARVYSALGFTYKSMGDYAPSVENLNHAIAIIEEYGDEYWPELGRLYYNRGVAYHGLNDTERAGDDINKAAEVVFANPPSAEVSDYIAAIYLTGGKIALDTGLPKEALERLDISLLLKAQCVPENQNEGADTALRSVPYEELTTEPGEISFYSDDAELASILCNRGLAYFHLGEPEKAVRDTDTALDILMELPNSERGALSICYGNLHLLAIMNGDFETALGYASDAVAHSEKWAGEQHPYTGLMYEYQGEALTILQRYDEALESYLRAYQIFQATGDQRGADYNKQKMKSIYEERLNRADFNKWLNEQAG